MEESDQTPYAFFVEIPLKKIRFSGCLDWMSVGLRKMKAYGSNIYAWLTWRLQISGNGHYYISVASNLISFQIYMGTCGLTCH